MAALAHGSVYDVTAEARTLLVDGIEVPAFHARPDGMPVAGVVLHPDMGGLRPLFEDMARLLATHGLAVLAFEQFASQPESVSRIRRKSGSRMSRTSTIRNSSRSFSAAADLLVVEDDVARVSMVGFCMGGHYVFKAASTDRFDAAVAFYGMLRTPDDWRGPGHRIEPLDVASRMVPTLAFFGTADPWTPAADIDALRAAWKDRPDCEMVVVEGAEHGFVHDPDRPVHRPDDAAAAWQKSLDWIT